jgi:outer membrane protein assembly factor BamB
MHYRSFNRGLLVGGVFLAACCQAVAQDWPQWRGPNRDSKITGFIAPKTWPTELTKKWSVTVGLGESSPVLVGDKLYVFSRLGGDEVTLCLDAATGKEVWREKYEATAVKGPAAPHPGPRSTPAVADGKVCTLGVAGVVSCLDASSGKIVWRKDTNAKPQFFTSYSPIIVDGKCVVYAGALTAYDLTTGEPKWEWKGGGAPYGSPVLMTVAGTKQLATPTLGALAGIGLADGKPLWEVKVSGSYNNTMSTPVVDGQTVYFSEADSAIIGLKIEKKGDAFAAKELWKKTPAAHKYNTPVLRDGLLFGISTKRNFFCKDAKTGDSLWPADKADTTQRGECGNILDAGSVLFASSSDGYLVVLEPSSKECKELAKYKVSERSGLEGPWALPIIAGKRIFVKDKDTLTLWTIE